MWPENWQALQVFLACQTQWRVIAGMGGVSYQGLDYPALKVVLQLHGGGLEMFEQVQLIERGALPLLNGV